MFDELFRRKTVDIQKAVLFGFVQSNGNYIYTTDILDGSFLLQVIITHDGKIDTKLTEKATDDEYVLYKTNATGAFIGDVRKAIETILIQIADKCYNAEIFKSTQAKEIIEKDFSGQARTQLLDFFRMRADMKTVESIYRQKQYFRADLIPQNGSFFSSKVTSFTPGELEEMLHAETAQAVLDTVRKTRYGKYLPPDEGIIERKTQLLQLKINQKNMRYSTCPPLVMLSFIGIAENEARNVTHIIEGIRYHLPPAEIAAHLIRLQEP